MNKLFNEAFGEILHEPDGNFLVMNWRGSVDEENYKRFWNTLFDLIIEKNSNKLIIDQRSIGNVSMQSRAWFLIKWIPKAKRYRPEFTCAVIASKHIFHSTGVHYLINGAKKLTNYDIVLFQSTEEASAYLKTKK
jgi:hypothetical protein